MGARPEQTGPRRDLSANPDAWSAEHFASRAVEGLGLGIAVVGALWEEAEVSVSGGQCESGLVTLTELVPRATLNRANKRKTNERRRVILDSVLRDRDKAD